MNRQETMKILAAITEVYPMYLNGRSMENSVNIWTALFSNESYKEV